MSSNGPGREQSGTRIQELQRQVQQMMQESQASLVGANKNVKPGFAWSNGQSESGGAEGTTTV